MRKNVNVEVFNLFSYGKDYLIAKVLWDNGINTEEKYIDFLNSADIIFESSLVIPEVVSVAVQNAIKDFESGFANPKNIPNIYKVKTN